MDWTLQYKPAALKQLKRLDKSTAERVVAYIESMVAGQDVKSEGKWLTGKWARHWSDRVGEYSLICRFENKALIVEVVRAGHRKDVYR